MRQTKRGLTFEIVNRSKTIQSMWLSINRQARGNELINEWIDESFDFHIQTFIEFNIPSGSTILFSCLTGFHEC